MSFVSSKGNILCRLIKIELYKIFAIINRAIKGLHCIVCVTMMTILHADMTQAANTIPHLNRSATVEILDLN